MTKKKLYHVITTSTVKWLNSVEAESKEDAIEQFCESQCIDNEVLDIQNEQVDEVIEIGE